MKKLKQSLKLWDVVAICVGAMFSSGFFLLPGLAFAHTGPSVFLAYIASGILILPSMLSQAELSTAMPKAGGTYFFLDRAFGPIMGTIGGMGTFLGLVLKTAFALIGFGAYLQLYMSVPIKTIAVSLAILFVVLNSFGAKESGKFQKILVGLLVIAMGVFVLEALRTLAFMDIEVLKGQFTNFFAGGLGEFFYTIAFVFVSYAGLTKIASVAEEVENPDRNIPLGMTISLVITVLIYGLGVFVVVALVPAPELMNDLKPIATAEKYAFQWLSIPIGAILVAAAALAAFASTGNAGILASSRYPLAMAKDSLIPKPLAKLNKSGVPTFAVLFTGALIILVILCVTEAGIAKFASAFQLLLFILINTAVIVMRESKISTYDPSYKSPFYPWMQILGIVISFSLLIYMGTVLLFTLFITMLAFAIWFNIYAAKKVKRRGAILHWFARLGEGQTDCIKDELWAIMKRKGIRENDPIVPLVNDSIIIRPDTKTTYTELVKLAADQLAPNSPATVEEIEAGLLKKSELGALPITDDLCVSGLRLVGLDKMRLVIAVCPDGFSVKVQDVHGETYANQTGKVAVFLLSPERQAALHLRLIAFWMNQAEESELVENCLNSSSVDDCRACFL